MNAACPDRLRGRPLERVLFALAGTVTLVSVALTVLIWPWFVLLAAFVGVLQWLHVLAGACRRARRSASSASAHLGAAVRPPDDPPAARPPSLSCSCSTSACADRGSIGSNGEDLVRSPPEPDVANEFSAGERETLEHLLVIGHEVELTALALRARYVSAQIRLSVDELVVFSYEDGRVWVTGLGYEVELSGLAEW